MAGRHRRRTLTSALATALIVAATPIAASMALAGRDRSAPTAPTDLRVTATTPYSVSLAWTASTDRSGIASYTICCAYTRSMTVPGSQTSATFTDGIEAGRSFTFFVVARDNAGNTSKSSDAVTVTTPRDTTPPSKPIVTVADIGPSHVSLAWSSIEDGPNVWFDVFVDGSLALVGSRATTGTFSPFEPESTHTFIVRARDFGGNASPTSDPLSVTTEAVDPDDATGPSMPGNLRTNGMQFPDGETWLFWDQSTDDRTPQSLIVYRVFVNGALDHTVTGIGSTILYGLPSAQNEYTVIAVDESGNQSAPATILVENR